MLKWLRRFSPLGWRLVAATVAFSTIVALLATVTQLFFDYRHELKAIDSTLNQVDRSYLPTITNAMWATNRKELQVALDGLVQLPDVRHVAVIENDKIWAQAGSQKLENIQSRDYPLIYAHRNEALTIGSLKVVVDMAGVYQRLLDKFWVILVTNGIKTFLVAGFMLWLFHSLVTRHLHRIAEFSARLSPDNLDERLALDRPAHADDKQDEFDLLVDGLARMQFNLSAAILTLELDIFKLEQAEAEIFKLNNALEQRVAERTADLEKANAEIFSYIQMIGQHAVLSVADLAGGIIQANDRFCEISGYTQAELLGQNHRIVNSGTHPKEFFARMWATITRGDIWRDEICNRAKDGTLYWMDSAIVPFKDTQGKVLRYISVRIDITKRKKSEAELLQAMAASEALNKELEAFSYSVSHDLRAPLRSIDGFSQALAEDYAEHLDAVGHDYLSRVRRAAQRMGLLIDDMLRLARITRAEMVRVLVDLSEVAREVKTDLIRHRGYGEVEFRVQVGLVVYGDPALLRILLENLLDNALKYSSKIENPVIELGSVEEDGRTVYFVRDNGAGFDMAYVGKLFGAFQRLHRAEEFPGTGVGLATVKRIVHRHGGEIWAEGQPGNGAIFKFTLTNFFEK